MCYPPRLSAILHYLVIGKKNSLTKIVFILFIFSLQQDLNYLYFSLLLFLDPTPNETNLVSDLSLVAIIRH